MVIEEVVLTAIIDAVFGHVSEKGLDKFGEWTQNKLGLNAKKRAFKDALNKTFEQFEQRHPRWVADNFDASFFSHEGAPLLAQLLIRDGNPDASELAARWADSPLG